MVQMHLILLRLLLLFLSWSDCSFTILAFSDGCNWVFTVHTPCGTQCKVMVFKYLTEVALLFIIDRWGITSIGHFIHLMPHLHLFLRLTLSLLEWRRGRLDEDSLSLRTTVSWLGFGISLSLWDEFVILLVIEACFTSFVACKVNSAEVIFCDVWRIDLITLAKIVGKVFNKRFLYQN